MSNNQVAAAHWKSKLDGFTADFVEHNQENPITPAESSESITSLCLGSSVAPVKHRPSRAAGKGPLRNSVK